MEGLSIDVVKALAERLEVQWAVDAGAVSDQDLISLVREERVDAALTPYNFDQIYANELCYTKPYIKAHQALAISRNAVAAVRNEQGRGSIRDLTGSVGVVAGSIHAKTAERLFDRMKTVEFESPADAVDAVLSGEATAAFGNEVELRQILRKRPASGSQAVLLALKSREASLRLAIAPQNSAFLEVFDSAVEAVRVTEPVDELILRYGR